MDHRLISIIIPVYNREDKIGRCLDSILAQTFHDLEILIVDEMCIRDRYRLGKEWLCCRR